jgi:hypothetical protein
VGTAPATVVVTFYPHNKVTRFGDGQGWLSKFNGAGNKNRTRDLLITSELLYRLSYTGIKEKGSTR